MFDCMVKGTKIGLLSLWINLGRGKYFLNAYYYGHYNTIKYEIEKNQTKNNFYAVVSYLKPSSCSGVSK